MTTVEPIPNHAGAIADLDGERALVIADYHAGIEAAFRAERGVELDSNAGQRRDRLQSLLDRVDPDRLVILGDLMHSIGAPGGAEREEVEQLLDVLATVPTTLIKGNHDGALESWVETVSVTDGSGLCLGSVGFAHGHAWPSRAVLEADVLCIGHEHPCVRLEDEVGGRRIDQAWLRGPLRRYPFVDRHEDLDWRRPELIVVPAFNRRVGGTWVNVEDQTFLAPFLPQGLDDATAYLLDGTRLGPYRSIS
jgi:hypothetical protein